MTASQIKNLITTKDPKSPLHVSLVPAPPSFLNSTATISYVRFTCFELYMNESIPVGTILCSSFHLNIMFVKLSQGSRTIHFHVCMVRLAAKLDEKIKSIDDLEKEMVFIQASLSILT